MQYITLLQGIAEFMHTVYPVQHPTCVKIKTVTFFLFWGCHKF